MEEQKILLVFMWFIRVMVTLAKGPLFLALFLVLLMPVKRAHGEDLMDIYGLAMKQDPGLKATDYRHQAVRQKRWQSYSKYLPTIAFEGEYIETHQEIKSTDNTVFAFGETDFPTTTYTLSLTQPVINLSYLAGIMESHAEVKRSEVELEAAKQELMLRAATRYLQVLASRDELAFARAEETAVGRHFELAKARKKMGLIPVTDLYDAKARLATVKASTIKAENGLDDALQALREVTGRLPQKISGLKKKLPLVLPDPNDADAWVASALKQNLSLGVKRYAVEVAKQKVRQQWTGHFPTLDLVARHNYRDTEGTLFGGGSEVETQEILLQLNVPLVQGGYVWFKTREAIDLRKAAVQEAEQERRKVMRETRSAYLGVKSAIDQVKALEQSLGSYGLALKARQAGFKAGVYTSLAVLDAERDLYMSKRDYAQARYDYITNSLKLRQAVGALREQDIAMVNQWLE